MINKKTVAGLKLNRSLLLFVLVLLQIPLAHGQETLINAAETLAFGIFKSGDTTKFSRGATKSAPPVDNVDKYRFQDFTNRIPMVMGTEFGIEYKINTKPKNRPINVTTIIRFPEPGLKQPRGRVYKMSKETQRRNIGEPHLHGYGFDEEWEMVPGEWVFEVWHKKAKLVSKTFTVYDPKAETTEAVSSD